MGSGGDCVSKGITRTLDPRAKKLAETVVSWSTSVRKGDLVWILGEPIALKFMEELARRVIDHGGVPIMDVMSPNVDRYMLEHGKVSQIARVPGYRLALADECDVRIRVDAHADPLYLQGVNPTMLQAKSKSGKPIADIIMGDGAGNLGKRWNVVGYPTRGTANEGGMTLTEYQNVLYGATNIDWKKASERMKRIKDIFDGAENVRVVVPGQTDLDLSLKGRGARIDDGKKNMPGGEVFYGPVEDSAEGTIYFAYPSIREGNLVSGITLKYENGKLVKFDAKKGMGFLEKKLAMSGMDRIGELGIGCNPGVTKYMRNLLFDEKLKGTVHLAVGMAYKFPLNNGGGKNEADDHWDLVCELRRVGGQPGGEIYVDNKLVQKNGVWQFAA